MVTVCVIGLELLVIKTYNSVDVELNLVVDSSTSFDINFGKDTAP